ncbi:MAG: hypothetical protein HOO96_43925, partial [Polyangiaceae bacterium]|nr:hypothetical protein [Polyangiaceae bacterium]
VSTKRLHPPNPDPPAGDGAPTHPQPLRWKTDPNRESSKTARNLFRGLLQKTERQPVDLGRLLGGVPIERNVVIELEAPQQPASIWTLKNIVMMAILSLILLVGGLAIHRATRDDATGNYHGVDRAPANAARTVRGGSAGTSTGPTAVVAPPQSATPAPTATPMPAPRSSTHAPAPTSTLRMKGILEP